jgi:septal ring factor EnvC (AmiA/AmiB activator)
MTQEVSKKFLQSKKAEDKYAFFLKATQLESLRERLHDAKESLTHMKATLKISEDKIPDLDKRIKQLQEQERLGAEAQQMGLSQFRTLESKPSCRAPVLMDRSCPFCPCL